MLLECSLPTTHPDTPQIAEWLCRLVPPGGVVELRALPHRKGQPLGGFFDADHLDDMSHAAAELSASGKYKGIYMTLNPLAPELFARSPNSVRPIGAGEASKNDDVVRRHWLLIDIDPARAGDVSATDAEKALAAERVESVREFLCGLGWPEPIQADSGNGYPYALS